jgi:hypothetical protein
VKLYELKKGQKVLHKDEILEFEEIRGEVAIFYNEWGIEIEFPDYLDVEEIGELIQESIYQENEDYPTLF